MTREILPTELPAKLMLLTYLKRMGVILFVSLANLLLFFLFLTYPFQMLVWIVIFLLIEAGAFIFGEKVLSHWKEQKGVVIKPFVKFLRSATEIKRHGFFVEPRYYYYSIGYGTAISTTVTVSLFAVYFAVVVLIGLLLLYFVIVGLLSSGG